MTWQCPQDVIDRARPTIDPEFGDLAAEGFELRV
jgi:hypothetical protein